MERWCKRGKDYSPGSRCSACFNKVSPVFFILFAVINFEITINLRKLDLQKITNWILWGRSFGLPAVCEKGIIMIVGETVSFLAVKTRALFLQRRGHSLKTGLLLFFY